MLAVHADLAKMLYVLCSIWTEVNSAAACQNGLIGEKKKLFSLHHCDFAGIIK